ncbi:uncharacterized protein LOC134233973 [Saccostrea cucullata]|uniref:uncharacterized protein LOC134233973 n=1 Tax=Saccostrea cuccullata TaxID=36930 RepID=UPI002ED545F1
MDCEVCDSPAEFTCKNCSVKLCTICVGLHMLSESENGHDVVKSCEQNESEENKCQDHPQQESSAFCKTCNISICVLCLSEKHNAHEIGELSEKVDTLSDIIAKENEQLQSLQSEMEKILVHVNRRSAELPLAYKKTKNNVTSHIRERHQVIDKAETALHKDLDKMEEKHHGILLKQKREFEEILKKLKSLDQEVFSLAKSKDVSKLMEFKLELENLQVPTFIEETKPAFFQPSEINESQISSYFGYIETLQSFKRPTDNLTQEAEDEISLLPKALDVPTVLTAFDAQFPASTENNNRLYSIVPLGDGRVWVGGHSDILKLFDQERLIATVNKKSIGLYLTLHEGHIVYPDADKTLKEVKNGKIDTLFSIGEWNPDGITYTAAHEFLVCLLATDGSQSKVVRYSSSGDVLQEIQYDSLHKPLFKRAIYVVENGNGDICVLDLDKNAVTVVDNLGIFRFSYTGNKASKEKIKLCSRTTDSMHHIIITDFIGDKIHILDRDGRFLRYIIPDQGIQRPRAVCVIREGELMVGECITGMIKRIKYLA